MIGLLLAFGALALLARLRSPAEAFNRTKIWAVAGLATGFALWFFGFLEIAGEYFAMWQSKTWNGQEAIAASVALRSLSGSGRRSTLSAISRSKAT